MPRILFATRKLGMEFFRATTRGETERIIAKIHAQTAIAADIEAGRYDRYCGTNELMTDSLGESAIPVDTRRGDPAMWERVFAGETVGEIDVVRIGDEISKIRFKDRSANGVDQLRPR